MPSLHFAVAPVGSVLPVDLVGAAVDLAAVVLGALVVGAVDFTMVPLGGALEAGRLSVNVRLLADPADRRYLTGLLHQVILVALAATSGVMAVLMLGLHGGPAITKTVTLYAFFGYCLLVIAAILALRVLVLVFRPDTR